MRGAKVLAVLLGAAALGLGAWSLVPVGTRAIPGEWAVAEVVQVELGGFPQTLLARGVDRRNPRLLFVHGGPGSGQLPAARHYSGELEKHFSVVHWDQRGAGASCAGVDWSTVTLERIVADTLELAEKLGDGEKIFLVGHSWGSLVGALAVQRRPELFHAYVGLGQLVHRDRQEQISYDWVVEQARREGNDEALAELGSIHPPYTTQREFELQRGWLGHYHGGLYARDRARAFLPAAIFGREYSVATRLRYRGCARRSLETLLPDRLGIDLLSAIPRLEVSVFFFVGRKDWNTPPVLVEEWAARLAAPHVELVWFEDAGHLLPLEAPDEFQSRLIEKLLPLLDG